MQRKNRLSRSRDFDAVYRHGRSASTRFLTSTGSQREDEPGEPRLGLAVPQGGRQQRRPQPDQAPAARDLARASSTQDAIAPVNDYVLVVRPGLPEAAEARGHEWLVERVDEVLGKAAA